MRIVSRIAFAVGMIVASVSGALAQVPPPGGPITAEAPLDSVAIIFISAALVYGVRLIKQSKPVSVSK